MESSKSLFSVKPEYQNDLETGELSSKLQQEFRNRGIPLSDTPIIETKAEGSKWQIRDEEMGHVYIVRKEGDTLNIQDDRMLNLVLEGGGVKGIGLVGAIEKFEEQGFSWAYLAGTSAGAIVATLLAVGFKGIELREILYSLDFRDVMDSKGFGKVPIVGPLWNLIKYKGFFNGDYILQYVRGLIRDKTGDDFYTFADLAEDSSLIADKLNLMVTDISNKKLLILPRDCEKIGTTKGNLDIALAMRMSMSFPFFFKPVIMNGRWIMDGGVLSNFPYWYVDKLDTGWDEPSYPTVGLLLDERSDKSIKGVCSMARALISTVTSPLDQAYDVYNQRVVKINVQGVSTLDFQLSREKKDQLYRNGVVAADKFLADDFNYASNKGKDLWGDWGDAWRVKGN